jgi:phosphoglycolate phosphatase-like HAD superfamily hydrolase
MDLVIFDIDGTLIHSHEAEVDCYIKAFAQVMGNSDINTDLTTYEHVTDTGITQECIYRQFQRNASLSEQLAIEESFLTLFDQSLNNHPPKPIPGVHSLFEQLHQEKNVRLAIATGSYHRSAMLKLKHANLLLSHLPLSSCSEHIERIEIMKLAKQKAHQHYQIDAFRSVTYVGDGPWDVKASQHLAWNFIGIASNYTPTQLKNWGVNIVLNDYFSINKPFTSLITNV